MNRRGLTLLEVLLAMAVLSLIAAVALPPMSLLLADRRMARSLDQLRIEISQARLDAMREGRVLAMRAGADAMSLSVQPYFGMGETTDFGASSQSALLTGGEAAMFVAESPSSDSAVRTIELPEGVRIESIQSRLTMRSAAAAASPASASALPASGPAVDIDESLPTIYFYPDGSTSDAAIGVKGPDSVLTWVMIRGVTGQTRIVETNES